MCEACFHFQDVLKCRYVVFAKQLMKLLYELHLGIGLFTHHLGYPVILGWVGGESLILFPSEILIVILKFSLFITLIHKSKYAFLHQK